MILTCKRCGNANPLEASFCFFDGQLLQNANNPSLTKKPELAIPFVFPNGRKCISFDELALNILDEWNESKNLLKDGTFAKFFQKFLTDFLSFRRNLNSKLSVIICRDSCGMTNCMSFW